MKRFAIPTVIVSLLASLTLLGCAGEPGEEIEPDAPVAAKLDTAELQRAPTKVVVNPGWICIATSGTCPTGKQMFYCHESGKESDGIFSCKDPIVN